MAGVYRLLKTHFLICSFYEFGEMKHNMLMNPKVVGI